MGSGIAEVSAKAGLDVTIREVDEKLVSAARSKLEKSTGRVYEEPCHRIMGRSDELPNTDWVAENHWCAPLYYRPESRAAALGREA